MSVSVAPKQRKQLERDMRAIAEKFPGGEAAFHALRERRRARDQHERSLAESATQLRDEWDAAVLWLREASFLGGESGDALTARGRACAAFADGQPLIMGTVIADGGLEQLSFEEICAWLCLFLRECKMRETPLPNAPELPRVSDALEATIGYSNELAEHLGLEPLDRKLSELMLDWTTHRDIHRIATRIDAALLGSFVKSVMRIVSYVDLVREVLLGLGMYETHNKLDSHMDRLFGGVVTNESLYLRMD